MSTSINFVSTTRKELSKVQQQDRVFFRYALMAVAVVFAFFLIALAGRLFFMFQLRSVETRQEQTRNAIISHEQLEADYTVFVHKLKALGQLFGKRKEKQEALIFFSEVFGPDVEVSGIDYTSSRSDQLIFSIRAPSIFVIESVFEILKRDDVVSRYKEISKDNLRRGNDGSYNAHLTVTFKDDSNPFAQEVTAQ